MVHKLQGLYFEDYQIGDKFETPGRTVTDAEISAYAGISMDFNPVHTDEQYAKSTIYQTRIAHGMLTLTIGFGLLTRLGLQVGTGMGLLGISGKFVRPVRIGDTISTKAEVISLRPTSKPDRGIVTFKLDIVNQNDEIVCEAETTHMVKRRG